MKVLKFGGTSVGSVSSMLNVADIVQKTKGRRLIVLSALSGTTNGLVAVNDLCENFTREMMRRKSKRTSRETFSICLRNTSKRRTYR